MMELPFYRPIKYCCLSRAVTSLEGVDLDKIEVYSVSRLVKASGVSYMGANYNSSFLEGLLS